MRHALEVEPLVQLGELAGEALDMHLGELSVVHGSQRDHHPDAASRGKELPQAEEARARSEAAASKERMKQRTPPVDWAEVLKRTFDFDGFACVRCGGSRRVLAYMKAGRGVRAILEHLGLPTAGVSLAPAQESIQAAGC
jgi:hypothetical protein